MIFTKENPVGIDKPIQMLQESLHTKLTDAFTCDVTAYGRAYVDNKNGVTKPLSYIGNGEYKELLTDDRISGLHFFFIEDDTSEVVSRTCMADTEVDIIFIIDDLTKVRGDITHYADEEIKEQIKSFVKSFYKITTVTKGEKALDGFDISQLQFIFPYFVFKLKVIIKEF
jgi:hypothetical protein